MGIKKLTLLKTLLMIGLIPLFVASIILTLVTVSNVKKSTEEDTYKRLRVAAQDLEKYYIWDIVHAGEAAYEHDYVDSLLDEGIELTLFLGDERYITSIRNDKGERNEGTKADAKIYEHVLKGEDYYSDNVKIGAGEYYVYYVPMKNESGKVIGMAFAGESENEVKEEITSTTVRSIAIAVVMIIICTVVSALVAIKIRKSIVKVIDVTDTLASGQMGVSVEMNSPIYEIKTLIAAASKLQEKMEAVISDVLMDVDSLDSNMGSITNKVNDCNKATESIALAVDEITRGTMDMAESVQKTAEQMANMGNDITEITQLASNASDASLMVQQESGEAKSQLEQLMIANSHTIQISDDVVAGINSSSEAISKIRQAADVIAQITSQTSMLALNASIEAARAGDSGRGFSVVASEISNLATQSDESTREIQNIVSEIISASEQNIILANRIKTAVNNEGEVLSQVSNSFEIVNDKIVQSAQAVGQITQKARNLDEAKVIVLDEINTLSAISQEDSASCEETNANMEELSANMENINLQASNTQDTSNMLKEAVAYFKIE